MVVEPSRSDCHAWGAHPLYHYHASVLGVRPETFGFETVSVRPLLGSLTHASGRIPHPRGEIVVEFHRKPDGVGLTGFIELPDGVKGTYHGQNGLGLFPGRNVLE